MPDRSRSGRLCFFFPRKVGTILRFVHCHVRRGIRFLIASTRGPAGVLSWNTVAWSIWWFERSPPPAGDGQLSADTKIRLAGRLLEKVPFLTPKDLSMAYSKPAHRRARSLILRT